MAKKSSEIYPFSLRLPDELKKKLDEAAQANHRQLTPEIVLRLTNSFVPLSTYTKAELIEELTERLKRDGVYICIGRSEPDK